MVILPLAAISPQAMSRPEKIKEGISYYSNDYVESGGVNDLAEDKNLEEVYQFYTYYEARYDAIGRILVFKEYKQGKVILEEQYDYEEDSPKPEAKTVLIAGEEPMTVKIGGE